MKIKDERNNSKLIEWHETIKGEVYEFSIPTYSDEPFIGMVIYDSSFNFNPSDDTLLIIDLEEGYGMTVYGNSQIDYIKKLKTELTIKAN